MPQIITEQKDVKVYFRVNDIYKNAKILVRDGDKVVLSKRKPRLAPGEMEYVTITAEQLKNAKTLDFCLEVQ